MIISGFTNRDRLLLIYLGFQLSRRLIPGQTVLTLGMGGVSIFALQFAKLFGAKVIITSNSNEKLDRAMALDADATVNYRTYPEWQDRVRLLTDGVGIARVVEVGGAGTMI